MPITGLVIVLDGRDGRARSALESIRMNERFTVGPATTAHRVPVVLETESQEESRRQLEWLNELPGAAMVEVVYTHFADVVATGTDTEKAGHGC